MKFPALSGAAAFAALSCLLAPSALAAQATVVDVRIDCTRQGIPLSPHLYGLFFEDINFSADGGLYAELVQNRSFEYHPVNGNDPRGRDYHPLTAWEKVTRSGATGEITVADSSPLNATNRHYLALQVNASSSPGATFGVANSGFDGIRLDAGARYDFSFHGRAADWLGDTTVTVALELPDGTVCGSTTISGLGRDWQKFEGVLVATQSTDQGRLVLTVSGRGTLALDMVSLFPQDTWLGRKHGLRRDLVESLRDLHPKFLRFPGGCIAHGDGLANAYSWKDSVGDVAERKANWNLWGYHQTYGLGYFEYFQLCADLGMQPLPVVPVGVSCGFRGLEVVPMNELQTWIDDALDLIEFANGPVASKWGAVRARMGHPEPFGLQFICLGNEEHNNAEVRERFPHFVRAIRARYPDIKIIGTSGLGAEIPIYDQMTDLAVFSSDEHYYESPDWFIAHENRFDSFDRKKPKIFVGEYASQGNTLYNALSEAVYLTGIERNGDIVDMACYAPLFARIGRTQWTPDLIFFDQRRVVLPPNYYVQQLFARHVGDTYLDTALTVSAAVPPPTLSGAVGVGTWRTSIEVDDLRVNGRKLDPATWQPAGGDYSLAGGLYRQSSVEAEPAMSFSPDSFSGDTVTYTVRARKTGGAEGFLLRFGATNGRGGYWWNVGGWNNTRHALEKIDSDTRQHARLAEAPGSVRNGAWHDLKVELSPGRIRCYLDGQLVHDYTMRSGLSASTTWDRDAREIVVKLVNPTESAITANLDLQGLRRVASSATLITLAGARTATNTVENPDAVKPVESSIAVSPRFTREIPPMSLQFIRLRLLP
jgi:alpha-L-arabinofuranosidase